jgi:hypothetical protein
MKIKSEFVKGVYYERWKTPIMYNEQLWLTGILQTINQTHMFFGLNTDAPKNIHVMTFERFCPYRLTEEYLAYHCIGKYFRKKKPHNKRIKKCSTWKLWNTSFILDLETANALSDYAKKRDKNIFEYLISTQDEDIEIISFQPPEWTLHENVKMNKLVNLYMKKSLE